ncbi:hypothetical protein C1H46_002801 [Malus baccata]|uniref:Uncharacterized protein n=1 Tax=Malus baccata TaxID=106549 RepID=A0A540NKN4_MALBA|nr:hypothetical protein C1H46_002801 [Malus baccata]
MAPYWNVMFDDVEASKDATLDDKSKGVTNADHNSEVTPSSKPKWKLNKGYHIYVGALPSSSRPTIVEAQNVNDVTQSLLRILEFKVKGKLEEGQVLYLQEENEDTEVSEHRTYTEEGINVIEAISLSNLEPFLGKGMQHKQKGMQLVHPFTPFESYKRTKVGDGRSTEVFVVDLDPM